MDLVDDEVVLQFLLYFWLSTCLIRQGLDCLTDKQKLQTSAAHRHRLADTCEAANLVTWTRGGRLQTRTPAS